MKDKQLSDLFADGTAPERDPAFALWVAAGIGRTRLRMRVLALARRATVMLMLAVAMFVAIRLSKQVLAQLVEGLPQFMGVPVPLVLGVLIVALVLRAQLHIPLPLRRFAPPPS
jgi:uncharacterized membrane protein AbrB (regulator of aidB expression)